jgi:hypothetical protein
MDMKNWIYSEAAGSGSPSVPQRAEFLLLVIWASNNAVDRIEEMPCSVGCSIGRRFVMHALYDVGEPLVSPLAVLQVFRVSLPQFVFHPLH